MDDTGPHFQEVQFDRTLNRMKRGLAEHIPMRFAKDLGGDKSVTWDVRRRLAKVKHILLERLKECA